MTASELNHAPEQAHQAGDAAPAGAAPSRLNSRRRRAGVTTALTLAAFAGSTLLASSPADAATIEAKALSIAASKHGDPYRYGAAGPNRFDCSGLTYYAFKHAGKSLPRTAQAQYNSVQHISKAGLRPGDLVFFHSGSYVYHVGIYAGGGKVWHAPYTGSYVKLERIWTSAVWYGRIR
ncbi:cell wall-associated NlpC family hydrolase [Streptomyces sp. 846.5]|nr:C40 family peptidase [Streptomyces sp. 846.5]TDT98742.1 cell wall-associated NlpC family hydrolase [Streptomyces sp. 846.5]